MVANVENSDNKYQIVALWTNTNTNTKLQLSVTVLYEDTVNYIHVALQVVRNIVVTTFDVTFLCDILTIHNGQYSSFVTRSYYRNDTEHCRCN